MKTDLSYVDEYEYVPSQQSNLEILMGNIVDAFRKGDGWKVSRITKISGENRFRVEFKGHYTYLSDATWKQLAALQLIIVGFNTNFQNKVPTAVFLQYKGYDSLISTEDDDDE